MLKLPRRDFLRGMLGIAAPAIVTYANIMPVKALVRAIDDAGVELFNVPHPVGCGHMIPEELNEQTLEDMLVELEPLRYSFRKTKEIYAANLLDQFVGYGGGYNRTSAA
jgi:hypothetical protein